MQYLPECQAHINNLVIVSFLIHLLIKRLRTRGIFYVRNVRERYVSDNGEENFNDQGIRVLMCRVGLNIVALIK